MTLWEFKELTGLEIFDDEDHARAFALVTKAYMNCKEDKATFCKNLMRDFVPFSQMARCKHLDVTYCLWWFMSIIGYTSYETKELHISSGNDELWYITVFDETIL